MQGGTAMSFIEPHAHMVCRTTACYSSMAQAGCIAIGEPAFWAGYDRCSPEGFRDYFRQLTITEPKRAAQFGIKHYCWLCINPKEAQDVGFAREVIAMIPEFLNAPNILGIGEIGLNRNTTAEMTIMEEQMDLAIKHNQRILFHTPHLEDKLKGTKLIISALKNRPEINPDRVLIDHCEEHTISLVKDAGYWAGMTLYPTSKLSPIRAVDILQSHGLDRTWLNSSCDWGNSDPLAVCKAGMEMLRRGMNTQQRDQILLHNPAAFLNLTV